MATPIYLSGPGAVRGSAPIVTKAAPKVQPKVQPKTKTLSPLDKLKSDFDKLNKLVNQYNAGGGSGDLPPTVGDTPVDAGLEYQKAQDEKARQDAFQELRTVFESYGMGSLADTITRMMQSGLTANAALVKLKYDKSIDPATGKSYNSAYTIRFAGNEKRIAAGLNAVNEASYLDLENSYAETLKSYGLTNMLSTDRTVNEAKFANYIGADISAVEFKDRIGTVEDRVVNADPATKAMFKSFYPNLTDTDLITYFLNPNETIGKLKEKATTAEIGAAAAGAGGGITADYAGASALAQYGIDRNQAIQGYAQLGEVLPTSQKLSNIYKEAGIDYTQKTGESEFMKSNADAAEQRKRLKSMERAQFMGDSAISQANYASGYTGSLGKSIQGKF